MAFKYRDIHIARRILHLVLIGILVASALFAGTVNHFFSSSHGNYHKMKEIAPAMTHVDVLQKRANVYFKDDFTKYETAVTLCRQGYFSPIYTEGCWKMMKKLSDKGYAPAQTVQANILIHSATSDVEYHRALGLYRQAARQNYEPAIIKLALLERVE